MAVDINQSDQEIQNQDKNVELTSTAREIVMDGVDPNNGIPVQLNAETCMENNILTSDVETESLSQKSLLGSVNTCGEEQIMGQTEEEIGLEDPIEEPRPNIDIPDGQEVMPIETGARPKRTASLTRKYKYGEKETPDKTPGDRNTKEKLDKGCNICFKASDNKMFMCKNCSEWVHYKCVEYPIYAIATLIKSKRTSTFIKSKRTFTCEMCARANPEIAKIIPTLEEYMRKEKPERIENLKIIISAQDREIDIMKEKIVEQEEEIKIRKQEYSELAEQNRQKLTKEEAEELVGKITQYENIYKKVKEEREQVLTDYETVKKINQNLLSKEGRMIQEVRNTQNELNTVKQTTDQIKHALTRTTKERDALREKIEKIEKSKLVEEKKREQDKQQVTKIESLFMKRQPCLLYLFNKCDKGSNCPDSHGSLRDENTSTRSVSTTSPGPEIKQHETYKNQPPKPQRFQAYQSEELQKIDITQHVPEQKEQAIQTIESEISRNVEPITCVEIQVAPGKAGLVIGKGGKNIRDIREKTHTKIETPPDEKDTFVIYGTKENISAAMAEICKIVEER